MGLASRKEIKLNTGKVEKESERYVINEKNSITDR